MAFTPPEIITEIFCNSGTVNIDYIIPPVVNPNINAVSQENGYPISQATPLDNSGTPISRAETNGIFRLYSSILRWLNVGGQYTFDNSIATAGGYPLGAILWCESNKTYQRSLINSNTANFVTTPSFINDGVNWATVTATPSIVNNSTNALTSTCISTVNSAYKTELAQDQLFTGNSMNGLMRTSYSITSGNASAMYNMSWNEYAGNPYPNFSLQLVTSDNRLATNNTYIDESTGDISSYWSIFSQQTPSFILDSGIQLYQGKRPTVQGDLSTLATTTSSIATLGDLYNTIKTKTYTGGAGGQQQMQMSAIRDNNAGVWNVTISGIWNSSNPQAIRNMIYFVNTIDLNAIFGISNILGAPSPNGTVSWSPSSTAYSILYGSQIFGYVTDAVGVASINITWGYTNNHSPAETISFAKFICSFRCSSIA